MTHVPRWRVYAQCRFVGYAHGACIDDAEVRARLLYDQRPLVLVSDAAWALLSKEQRAIYEGTEPPAPEKVRVARRRGIKTTLCRRCNEPVPQPKRPPGTRAGRPRRYHDECMSKSQRRWREREQGAEQIA